ncbi:transglutaminase domain-containing protein, partial [Endozoicomonas sp. ONNA1]|uniref:transglutaminase domain-containing protein n=1 Tax=Endozoicomonas sp. ONNA1 TaxID=2828740 RepID=UPI00214809DE
IDSQHLEGELNDILAGDAHPGFHLFATINPPEYSGRKPLSPALKGRFRHLPIRQYSPAELQTIAEKVLPKNPQGKILAEQLTKEHCRLRAYLQRKKLPLQPTSLDLQNVARAVIRGGDFSENGLHQCLNQHYRLYLMAAKTSLEALPESSTLVVNNSALDSGLCEWFNQTVSGIDRPWLVRRSDFNSIDEKRHEIRVKADLNEEEARTEIIKRVAEARWQASGLSLNPDESDDILTQALYRHWQQRWFDHEFGQVGMDANGLFSLTKEQKLTLKMPASQPYLREADKRIEAWNAHGAKWWTAFWHQMNDLLNHWVDESGEYTPQVQEKQAMTLDWETNYENEETPQVSAYKIFETRNHPSHMHRQWARDIDVSAEGSVELIDLVDQHIHGVESLMPTRLPEHGQELTLASDQTLATLDISSDDGQYALPSLTANDYIVALRIEPDLAFTLIRDRYTGLHTLSVPAADAEQSIRCVYVLETRKPGKKTPAKEARPKRSTHPDTRCSEGMKTVLNSLFDNIAEQPSSKVRRFLRALKKARGTTQRIETITNYCRKFTGKAKPEKHKNFFKFLVTQRQGSCRHRVPVFIAFCRYFGISCRQIDNAGHCFAEYSVDGGQTWESVDLDGAPVRKTEITPEFQPTKMVSASSTETRKIKTLLKGADSLQQQTLAKACDVSPEELKKALETNSALPETHLSIAEMVRNLWLQKDLTSFAMGVSIIELLETKALGKDVMALVGAVIIEDDCRIVKPMSEAVRKILYESDEDRVTEQLKLLHSKLVVEAGASPLEWLRSMQNILKYRNLAIPSVIHFAIEALESGWLDPLATYKSHIMEADEHHSLLVRLTRVDELKDKAAHCLKKWYREFFSKEKNSQVWQLAYKDFQKRKGDTLFVTHGHDGFSSFLEGSMTISSIQNTWTDQPGGIPNIERMLVHQPAFPKLNSGKANQRPVIILGQPSWRHTAFNEKVEALYQRKVESSPHLQYLLEKSEQYNKAVDELHCALDDLKSEFHHTIYGKSMRSNQEYQAQQTDYENKKLDIENEHRAILKPLKLSREDTKPLHNLRDRCRQAIRQAFSHYLYEVTHSKAGHLTFCWARATIGEDTSIKNNYGAHNPSSPEELYAMISEIDTSSDFEKSVDNVFLQQTLNVSNALVLKSDELTKIAGEFLSSVNLNSIYESLDA